MSNLKIYSLIAQILGSDKMTGYALQQKIYARTERFYSESTITRRLREMGAKATPPRDRKKSTAWMYSL